MKTYLVTGGAGFIGSNFIHYMLNKYREVIRIINIDLLTYAGNLENLKELENKGNYIFIKADICDKEKIEEIFTNNDIDYVVNFAAESHVDRSIRDPEVFVRTNVLGTQCLLNIAKDYWEKEDETFLPEKKFLQVSTDEVYGSLENEGYFTEDTPLDPHSPYSASKAAADMIVKAYYDTYKMPVNITRCSNNYGRYQFPEKLIPLVINNVLSGKKLPVYGDGKNIRDWLYVEDHCIAIDQVINNGKPGEVYNIGGHNERQNIDIVKTIIKTVKNVLEVSNPRRNNISEELIKFVRDRKGHDRRYAIDSTKITSELGWFPKTQFEQGIVETVKWYIQNIDWIENVTSGEYKDYYRKMYEGCDRNDS